MHTIYSYGGGEYLYYIFNFVAMLVRKDGGISTNIIRMVAVSGVISTIVIMYMRNSVLPGATWLLWFMIGSFIVVGPTGTINIKDPIAFGGHIKSVDNVPLILVIGASSFSAVGHALTESIESTFIVPGGAAYLKYIETGSLFGSKVIKGLNEVKIDDPVFHANVDRFVQQCVVYDAMIGRKYTLRDLETTPDIWRLVSSQASPVLGFLYKDEARNEIVTCREGARLLNEKWERQIDSSSKKRGQSLFGIKRSGDPHYTEESAKNLFNTRLAQSYRLFSGIAARSSDILKQQMMIESLRSAPAKKANQLGTSYALAKATIEQRNNYHVAGLMAEESLVVMRAVFEALLYGAFIFVYILMFLPSGYKVLGYYFQALCWIQLWAPLYAILNFIMTLYGHYRSVPMLGEFGLSRANSAALVNLHTDIMALAGWLSLSIPYLSYMLLNRGGVAALAGLANYVNSSRNSPIATAAAELTTGNISLGNYSQGNMSMQNMSAYKYNTSSDFQSGQFSKNLDTGAMKINSPDNVVYLGGQGRTVSTFSTEITEGQHLSMQLSLQSQHEKALMESNSADYSKQVANTTRDVAELVGRLSNSSINLTGHSNDNSLSDAKSLTNAIDFSKRLQEKFGLSASSALEASVGLNLPIIGGQIKNTAGANVSMDKIRDFAKSEGYRENLDSIVKSAKTLTFNDQQNKEKLLVDQITSSFESATTLRESMVLHKQASDRLSNAANLLQSSNFDTRTIRTQDLLNFIANSPGDYPGSKIGYDRAAYIIDATSGPNAEIKQEYLSRFEEARTGAAVAYFTQNEIKSDADLERAFNTINAGIQANKPIKDHGIVLNNEDAKSIQFNESYKDNIVKNTDQLQTKFNEESVAKDHLITDLEHSQHRGPPPANVYSKSDRELLLQQKKRIAKFENRVQENKQHQE